MKRIKQIEESKQIIGDALISLMQSHLLGEITISQIALEAKIGRNTFYNHFKTKEDVIKYLMENSFSDAIAHFQTVDNPTVKDMLLWRFRFLQENPLWTAFQGQPELHYYISNFRDEKIPLFQFSTEKDDYQIEFIKGGINYMTAKWILGGMKESPKEMVLKIVKLVNVSL